MCFHMLLDRLHASVPCIGSRKAYRGGRFWQTPGVRAADVDGCRQTQEPSADNWLHCECARLGHGQGERGDLRHNLQYNLLLRILRYHARVCERNFVHMHMHMLMLMPPKWSAAAALLSQLQPHALTSVAASWTRDRGSVADQQNNAGHSFQSLFVEFRWGFRFLSHRFGAAVAGCHQAQVKPHAS